MSESTGMRYGDCIAYEKCKCPDKALGSFASPVSL